MEKTRRYIYIGFIALLLSLPTFSFSQISLNILIRDNSAFKQSDVWQFVIVNSSVVDISAHANIVIAENTGEEVLQLTTPSFQIKRGLNGNLRWLELQSNIIFGSNESGEYLSRTGALPGGKYTICIKIIPNDNVGKTEKCIDISARENLILRHQYPLHNSEIFSSHPNLRWICSSTSPGITYALRVTYKEINQSRMEALENNQLYVNEKSLVNNSFFYPITAPPLKPRVDYVWQVVALRKNQIVAECEPWLFHLGNTDTILQISPDCYRLIEKLSNNESYINDGILRFGYQNRSNDKELKFRIIDQVKNEVCESTLKIPLKYGINKIDVDLRKHFKVKNKRRYLLEITDSDSNSYQLVFTILNNSKI